MTEKIPQMKIAVILHLFHKEIWREFKEKLQLLKKQVSFDFYVSICRDHVDDEVTQDVIDFGGKVFKLENKGLDIGPFLYILKHIFENDLEYDCLLKIHTKKKEERNGFGRKRRRKIIKSLIGTEDNIRKNLIEIRHSNMITESRSISKKQTVNKELIEEFLKLLELEFNDEMTFAAGTMFWAKMSVFEKHLNINLLETIYESLEEGRFYNKKPTKTHALERIFGYMACQDGEIVGVDADMPNQIKII